MPIGMHSAEPHLTIHRHPRITAPLAAPVLDACGDGELFDFAHAMKLLAARALRKAVRMRLIERWHTSPRMGERLTLASIQASICPLAYTPRAGDFQPRSLCGVRTSIDFGARSSDSTGITRCASGSVSRFHITLATWRDRGSQRAVTPRRACQPSALSPSRCLHYRLPPARAPHPPARQALPVLDTGVHRAYCDGGDTLACPAVFAERAMIRRGRLGPQGLIRHL